MQSLKGRVMGKMIFKFQILLYLITAFCQYTPAQAPTAALRVMNVTQSSLSTISFDLWLKNTSTVELHYYIGQYFFEFNKNILNGEVVIE
jgi:hypothetical protein